MAHSGEYLELLLRISRELAITMDLPTVLDRVLTLSTDSLGVERGSLVVLNADRQPVDAAIVVDGTIHTHTVEQLNAVVRNGLAGWVIQNQLPALVADTSKDERWLKRPYDAEQVSKPQSVLCIPLIIHDHLVGVLTLVQPQPGYFGNDHLLLVQAIGDLAAIAIHNAQLYASLEQAHDRYYQLFESSIDPIFITTQAGKLLEANLMAVDATCYHPDEEPHRDISQFHNVDWDKVGKDYSLISTDTPITYESALHCSNGDEMPVEVNVRAVKIDGEVRFQWIFHNISGQKDLEKLREDLSAMVYHDLRSPLANVISSLDILSTMLPTDGPPALKTVMQIATRSTDRMQRLISSLLDVNRLEAGQPLTTRRSVNPAELIEEAVETIQPTCESKQQRLDVNLISPLPPILADGDMIRRVLINLLENATKFTPLNGTITFGARASDEVVLFWVKDTGPGIPAEARERIFDKFTRLQVDRAPKGFGLGLAFCRLAVNAHGGRIWVESKVGEGSTFYFEIPVAQP